MGNIAVVLVHDLFFSFLPRARQMIVIGRFFSI